MIGKSILSLMLILSLAYGYAAQATLPARLEVALSTDSYPYMFTDTNGQVAGLAVDYWREVARQENIQIDFVVADWPDTIKLLQQGKVQLHGAIGMTQDYALGGFYKRLAAIANQYGDVDWHLLRIRELDQETADGQ